MNCKIFTSRKITPSLSRPVSWTESFWPAGGNIIPEIRVAVGNEKTCTLNKHYYCLLVPCKKCSNVSSEFGYISRLQPWCVRRFTYIWIAAPVFYYPLGEVFWDFPFLSPLACCCSLCFSLPKIPTFFPCFSMMSILCMRERNPELIERRRDLVLRQIWTLLLSLLQELP